MSKIFDTLTFSWYFSRSIPHLSHSHKSAVKCQKNNSLHQNIVRTLLISMRYLNITIRHFIEIENFISGKRKNQPGAFQFDPYRQKWKRNCNLCQAIFGHPMGLENHLKSSSNKDGSFRCGKERAKPDPNKPKAYQCNLCDKSFQTYAGLKGHVETVHKKIRHACHQCDKSFTLKSHLLKHHRTVHTVVNHRACPTCGETFTVKGSLDRHIRDVHQNHQPHKCNECGKVFGRLENLKRHINSVHKGLKPFACQICGRKFDEKWIMNRHAKAAHQDKA